MAKIVQLKAKTPPAADDPFDPAKLRLDNFELVGGIPCRPILTAKQQRQRGHFVQVPLEWAALVSSAAGESTTFVAIWLLYRAWKTKSNTVTVSSGQLEAHGIDRWVKRRALRKLEAAGLITVKRQHGRAPVVTLLHVAKDVTDAHG